MVSFKTRIIFVVLLLIFFVSQRILADTHYVSKKGNNTSPYTSWETAANVIQDAVDAAADGDTVLVNNGTYKTGGAVAPGFSLLNRVMITNVITIKSVNGPKKTKIVGKKSKTSADIRCVYIGTNAQLSGFTLKKGHTIDYTDRSSSTLIEDNSGGGAFLVNRAVISNCIIKRNIASRYGNGVYCKNNSIVDNCIIKANRGDRGHHILGGGIYCENGIIRNCTIEKNITGREGSIIGAGMLCYDSVISNCLISKNIARTYFYSNGSSEAGGIYSTNSLIIDCVITKNKSKGDGGGIHSAYCIVKNCLITKNIIRKGNGMTGAGVDSFHDKYHNCMIRRNKFIIFKSFVSEGGGVACSGSTFHNCTITENSAQTASGIYGNGLIYNSIIFFNKPDRFPNYGGYGTNIVFNHCYTQDPHFVNLNKGDLHLKPDSPCIDAGTNMPWMVGAKDLDGKDRIKNGTVDIGVYEQ